MAAVASKTVKKERRELQAKLERWRELLLQKKAGVSRCQLPIEAIRLELNVLLDEWVDMNGGRGRDPGIWDRVWVPSWPVKRMTREL